MMVNIRKPCFKAGWTIFLFLAGCTAPDAPKMATDVPNVSPKQPAATEHRIDLADSRVEPMYREVLAVNLPTVVRVAAAENLDILQAREQIKASAGLVESAEGSLLPSLAPTLSYQDVQGRVRATEGHLVGVGFQTLQTSIAVQWVLNPGKVKYDIIAAKKRLNASEQHERAVLFETLRKSATQYYDLVLAQARVAASRQAVSEARELLRINQLHQKTGTGVPADVSRAQAHLAQQQQVLLKSINSFYDASVALSVTLHLDASVTLVPEDAQLVRVDLVQRDLDLDDLLALAVRYRPDLESIRLLAEAINAGTRAQWWSEFGPLLGVVYRYGGIESDDGITSYSFKDQQQFSVGAGGQLSLSSFGAIKAAKALERQALSEADRRLDEVRAQVVQYTQDGKLYRELISKTRKQLSAAEEAHRLIETGFEVGTMTLLDVLQSQETLAQARLQHAEAVVLYNAAQVNLLAALGLIDEDKLSVVVQASNP